MIVLIGLWFIWQPVLHFNQEYAAYIHSLHRAVAMKQFASRVQRMWYQQFECDATCDIYWQLAKHDAGFDLVISIKQQANCLGQSRDLMRLSFNSDAVRCDGQPIFTLYQTPKIFIRSAAGELYSLENIDTQTMTCINYQCALADNHMVRAILIEFSDNERLMLYQPIFDL